MSDFTKKAIKSEFIKMLNEKPLSQITVKSLVEACGINRNTFYYHYQDIPALIEEIVQEEVDRIVEEYPTVDSLETALNAVIDFASKNRRAILHIYRSVNRDIFETYLWRVCDYVVNTYAETVLAGHGVSPEDTDILKRCSKCLCFGLCIEWMNSGMNEDVHKRIQRFCELQKGSIEEIIQKCEET